MHGLAFVFLKGRERLVYFLTMVIVALPACFVAGKPHRKIVDGEEVVEPVILGHIVPMWLFFVVFLPVIGVIWAGVRYLLDRFWPEKEVEYKQHQYANQTVKGAWTAKEYLLASPLEPIACQFEGTDWLEQFSAFQNRTATWLATATDATLRELVPAAREIHDRFDEEVLFRLAEAHEKRSLPTLQDLNSLADEIGNDDLHGYVRERGEETAAITVIADRVHKRQDGGFVAWKGDGPDAGSPLDYVPPRLRSALDYLQAEEPPPTRVLLGEEIALKELAAFAAELERWLNDASEGTLRKLVPAARSMLPQFDEDTIDRLVQAHDRRQIPTREELLALSGDLTNEELREYLVSSLADG